MLAELKAMPELSDEPCFKIKVLPVPLGTVPENCTDKPDAAFNVPELVMMAVPLLMVMALAAEPVTLILPALVMVVWLVFCTFKPCAAAPLLVILPFLPLAMVLMPDFEVSSTPYAFWP